MFIQVSRPPPGLQRELTEPRVERSPIQLFHTIHRGLAQAGGSHPAQRGWNEGLSHRSVPSQVIMGPGSKPSSQAHSKPPTTLVQVPFPQGLPMEHSSVSGEHSSVWRRRMGKGWAGLLQGELSNCPSRAGREGKGRESSDSLPAHPHSDPSPLERGGWSRREQGTHADPHRPPQSLTHAVDPGVVQVVAEGALAAEGAVGVDAGPVDAHAQVLRALVHVWEWKMKLHTATNSPVPSGLTRDAQAIPGVSGVPSPEMRDEPLLGSQG